MHSDERLLVSPDGIRCLTVYISEMIKFCLVCISNARKSIIIRGNLLNRALSAIKVDRNRFSA